MTQYGFIVQKGWLFGRAGGMDKRAMAAEASVRAELEEKWRASGHDVKRASMAAQVEVARDKTRRTRANDTTTMFHASS